MTVHGTIATQRNARAVFLPAPSSQLMCPACRPEKPGSRIATSLDACCCDSSIYRVGLVALRDHHPPPSVQIRPLGAAQPALTTGSVQPSSEVSINGSTPDLKATLKQAPSTPNTTLYLARNVDMDLSVWRPRSVVAVPRPTQGHGCTPRPVATLCSPSVASPARQVRESVCPDSASRGPPGTRT
jgi:hypothetical protein